MVDNLVQFKAVTKIQLQTICSVWYRGPIIFHLALYSLRGTQLQYSLLPIKTIVIIHHHQHHNQLQEVMVHYHLLCIHL